MTKTLHITSHARLRMAQRGITERELGICLNVGETYHRTGAVFYIMTGKILNKISDLSTAIDDKLNGLTAIVKYDTGIPTVTTVYKNQNAVRTIRKKVKQNLKVWDL